jgi:hypothetical protein
MKQKKTAVWIWFQKPLKKSVVRAAFQGQGDERGANSGYRNVYKIPGGV